MDRQVVIIGGGAAGLAAGIFAAQTGAKVLILEKNAIAGKKILVTGGGRCNLTHTGEIGDFVKAYGPAGLFVKPSLYCLSPEDTVRFFEEGGLRTRTDEFGRVHPASQSAGDVKKALVKMCERAGAEIQYDCPVRAIAKREDGFEVEASKGTYPCKAVIICTGGKSWPRTGSTGDGYKIAKAMGHEIITPRAGLTEVILDEKWLPNLAGVTLENVSLRVAGEKKKAFSGSMVFTHRGISGPAAMNISSVVNRQEWKTGEKKLILDFIPERTQEEMRDWLLRRIEKEAGKDVAGILCELLPKSVCREIVRQASGSEKAIAGQMSKKSRNEILMRLKETKLTLQATGSLEEATVTLGGVSLSQVDGKRMASKLVDGLFFAGEVLDADGPCGGYNLQMCWSTGALAGQSAATY